MGFWRKTINHAYRLSGEERDKLEEIEHEAYVNESLTLAQRRGRERARQDYD